VHPLARSIVVVTLAAVMWGTPVPASAVEPDQLWMFQGIEDIHAMDTLPDVDGDGVPDVLVETYDAGASGDHIYLLSGGDSGTPQIIWSNRPGGGLSDGGGYGDNCLTACPDLFGDGLPDVLLGTAWGNRSVHALDGLTGEVQWSFDTTNESQGSGWVYCVQWHPDRTADGIPEVVFGAGSDNETGYMLDGASGLPIWRFYGAVDAIGYTLSLPDLSGDDLPDVLFCGWDNDHRVYCVSGASEVVGQQVWSVDTGASNHAATVIDDIDDDGVADLVVGRWSAHDQVRCLSGADGDGIWTFENGTYNYIMRLVTISDVDADGVRDVAIGSWDRAVRVVSGASGDLIWQSYAGSLNGGDFWTIERVDDIDGDGLDEVVGGSFDYNVYLFSGADGDTLWLFNTGNRLYSVRGAPDLSANGKPDVLAGTQYLGSGGRAFALEGGEGPVGVGELPASEGVATLPAGGDGNGGSVALSWGCAEPLAFRVYRVIEAAEQETEKAAARTQLASAFARGETTTREVLAAVRAEEGQGAELLTPEPITPRELVDGWWRYEWTDRLPEATDPQQTSYRLAALLNDGREIVLLELRPTVTSVPRPLLGAVQVAPNPFNATTTVHFELDRDAEVSLAVHDLRGRRVGAQPAVHFPAGFGEIRWEARGFDDRELPAGIYLLTLRAGGEVRGLRAALVR